MPPEAKRTSSQDSIWKLRKVKVDRLISLIPSVDSLLPMLPVRSKSVVRLPARRNSLRRHDDEHRNCPASTPHGSIHGENMVLLDGENPLPENRKNVAFQKTAIGTSSTAYRSTFSYMTTRSRSFRLSSRWTATKQPSAESTNWT